ncbi:MAG: DNA primase [Bacteroidales bacterium]|jgi:DNA primase|nr:DNA primase [Bacteroidales bacterium]
MIDRTTVDRIFDAARIVDVVGEFVSLKRRGVNYFGCCPFHNERTPSFSVNPARNIYKCFGCGKAGNSVNFIMEHEHLGYADALRYLAKKYNIPIEEKEQTPEEKQLTSHRESLVVVSAYAARVFHDNLFNTREGTAIGLSYFKERGFREDIIKNFELGYSLEARSAFTQKALKDGYREDFLVETGLSIQGERGIFDRFSGRVIFPIHSLAGKVIAFGGRVLKTDKKTAKYLNSPESEIYHKSKVLYGIFQAKKSIVQNDKCFLVEGYTDVLSMHQAGIENVVASSGTALTVEQIQLVKRFTPNITVLYDGDPAGIKASLRGIDLILQEDMNVKVLLLPDGEDPDSFARSHSASELEEYIRASETDFITFKAQLLLDDARNDPIKRSQLITDVVQSIALIPKAIMRSVYLKECARMFEMDEQMLTETSEMMRQKKIADQRRTDTRNRTNEPEAPKPNGEVQNEVKPQTPNPELEIPHEQAREQKELIGAEKEIIRLMLRYGQETLVEADEITGETGLTVAAYIIRELCMDELDLQQPLLRRIFEEYKQLSYNGAIVGDLHFTQHPDPEISRLVAGFEPKYELSNIHRRNGTIVKTEENSLYEVVPVSVLAYKHKRVMMRLKEISHVMQQAEIDHDMNRFETLCMQYKELTHVKKALGLTLGKRIYN